MRVFILFAAWICVGLIGGCPHSSKMVRPHSPGINLMEDDSTTVKPRHMAWDRYNVSGLVLVNPAVRDSTGGAQWMPLPVGSVLLFPRWVDGPAPGDPRQKS